MKRSGKPALRPSSTFVEGRGYQPKPATNGPKTNTQDAYQPTKGQAVPSKPPSNPPNQGTSGKKLHVS